MSRNKEIEQELDRVPSGELEELSNLICRDLMMAYICFNVGDLFDRRCHNHVQKYIPSTRFKKRKEANMMLKYLELAIRQMDMESIHADQTFYEYQGADAYDRIRQDSYELARFIQLYTDRVRDRESAKKVEDLLMSMPTSNVFTEEEINIKMK